MGSEPAGAGQRAGAMCCVRSREAGPAEPGQVCEVDSSSRTSCAPPDRRTEAKERLKHNQC
jgi:hypothetical protein